MLFGIDVGGTHTDAVLIDKHGGVLAWVKIPTDPEDLLSSIHQAIKEILSQEKKAEIDRFNLSTTLCTNAIVQDQLESVGVLISAGPGIDPGYFKIGDYYEVIPGGLDHRGTEISPIDINYASSVIADFLDQGIKVFAVISKFSPRNPIHEEKIVKLLDKKAEFVTAGHTLSGQLNFPRRIATAYYNSAVWPIFNNFLESVEKCLKEFNLNPQINILKADGGTMPMNKAKWIPVESIFSGPAASVMGIVALCPIEEDAIVLDIGGTTTDIGVFASGVPLIEPENVQLKHRPTLVRAMKVKSIGLGGDSAISIVDNTLKIGPKREGPCMAQGGDVPAFLDAINCISEESYGDVNASYKGMEEIGKKIKCAQHKVPLKVIECGCNILKQEVMSFLDEINERPIYTIHELLEYRKIEPKKIYLMGGPAKILAGYLEKEFNLPVIVPEYFSVANAIGAALARPTTQAELFADTEKRLKTIPVFGIKEKISGFYNLKKAREDLIEKMRDYIKEEYNWDIDYTEIEVIEESSMNMVKDEYTVGQDIRVKCQVKPGICKEYENSVRCICKR